jgi:hypothetical protein
MASWCRSSFALAAPLVVIAACLGASAAAAALPKDPCVLLQPGDIQAALAPKEKVGSGSPDTSMAPLGVSCAYEWGPRTKEWGKSSLTVNVIDASKAWQGTSADGVARSILAKVKPGDPNAALIPGVADAAVFIVEPRSNNATAEAYVKSKGIDLSVVFHQGNPAKDKDALIALLKQAIARL